MQSPWNRLMNKIKAGPLIKEGEAVLFDDGDVLLISNEDFAKILKFTETLNLNVRRLKKRK